MAEKDLSHTLKKNQELRRLCERVEETFGHRAVTPKHFEALSQSVFQRTGILLSPTTLKRLWGYLNESVAPRQSTIDTLAIYCGWVNWSAFCRSEAPEVESGTVGGKSIDVGRQLKPGDRLRLMWHPQRICDVVYRGDMQFEVEDSSGTRLSKGDTFKCRLIISGEPLYVDDYCHGDMKPGVYVCGRHNGVKFIFPLPVDD